MKLTVIEPHGFCSGVTAAVCAADAALAEGHPVWCLHELVHNETVVAGFRARGMIFVNSLDQIPYGSRVLFSAHGVTPAVRADADARGLKVIDATCPFVMRVHREVRADADAGLKVIVIGHATHAEVVGVAGEAPGRVIVVETVKEAEQLSLPPDTELGVVAQTTLSAQTVDSVLNVLRMRFPRLRTSPASGICYATSDRQLAVADFVRTGGDAVLVIGSSTSSNTRRLVETAREAGARFAVRVSGPDELAGIDFSGVESLGITSGASTPESVLTEVVAALRRR